MSRPVSTACTPGIARAADVSIDTIFACAIVPGTKSAQSIPGMAKSAVYCACPDVLMLPSTRNSSVLKRSVGEAVRGRSRIEVIRYRSRSAPLISAIRAAPLGVSEVANLGVHRDVAAPPCDQRLAVREVIAVDRIPRGLIELVRPFAQRVAEPGRLRPQRRQPQFLPDLPRILHVLALGQRDRRKLFLEHRIDEHRRVLAVVAFAARAVPLILVVD